jgi:Ni,Fe-hydrogenase maturation factor
LQFEYSLQRFLIHIFLIGVQPVELEDFGGSLRDKVKAQIQPAIESNTINKSQACTC